MRTLWPKAASTIVRHGAIRLTTRHKDASRHGTNEGRENVVITNLIGRSVIHRHQGFVVAIIFVAIVIAQFTTVTRVVTKNDIAFLGFTHDLFVGGNNVGVGWLGVCAIVHQNGNVLVFKPMHILDVFEHVTDIIVAAFQ